MGVDDLLIDFETGMTTTRPCPRCPENGPEPLRMISEADWPRHQHWHDVHQPRKEPWGISTCCYPGLSFERALKEAERERQYHKEQAKQFYLGRW